MKIAYADFVTAMMAFFLLMWLLGSIDGDVRGGIAEYFKMPVKVALTGSGASPSAINIKGGGQDSKMKAGAIQKTNESKEEINIKHQRRKMLERID